MPHALCHLRNMPYALCVQVLCHLRPLRRAAADLQADSARLDTALETLLRLRQGIEQIAEGTARGILLNALEVSTR